MKEVYKGQTETFEIYAEDAQGTTIDNGTAWLMVHDSTGSNVLGTQRGTFVTSGTYRRESDTSEWATGPVRYNWKVESSVGTSWDIKTNEIRIVGAGTESSTYVFEAELKNYFPGIIDYLDSSSNDHIIEAYEYQNRLLDNLGYSSPVPKDPSGRYDQSLKDFNAWEAIYRIVKPKQINQVQKEEDGKYWFDSFHDSAMKFYDDWDTKKITFKKNVAPSEAGIGPASRDLGSSVGTLVNNADEVYGSGFRGSDYKRTWYAKVVGTGTSGGISEGTVLWSKSGGLSWGTVTSSPDWVHLEDQVYIRFTRGTSTGTENILANGDRWTWETNPVRNQVGGNNIARGYGI